MNRSRQIFGGVAWLMAGQLWSWALRLLEATIVPRYLKAGGVGTVSYAGVMLSVVAMLVSFGGYEYITRALSGDKEQARDGEKVVMAMLLARAVLLLPLLISVYLLCRFALPTDPRVVALLPIFIISAYLGSLFEVVQAWRQGYRQFAVVARTQMISQSVGLPATILLVMAGFKTAGAAWGGVINNATSLLAVTLQKGSPVKWVRVQWSDFTRMARESLPFFRYRMFLWFYGDATSVLYISWIAGLVTNGWYVTALKLVSVLFFIPATLVQVLLPVLSNAYQTAREEYEELAPRCVNLTLVLALPLAAVLIFRAPTLLELLYPGGAFRNAGILMQIIGCALWLRWASMCYGLLLIVTGRETQRANAATLAAPYNLLMTPLGVYLAHRYLHNGAIGALIVAETTELLMVCFYLRHLRGTGLLRQNIKATGRGLIAAVVPVLVLQLPIHSLSMFLLVGSLAVLLYLPAAVLTGALPRSELQLLLQVARSRGQH